MLKLICFPFLILCFFLSESDGKIKHYNLSSPDATLILSDTLREVSDVTTIDANSYACIQDENGILFICDITKNKIKNQYFFNINGDYEGITKVGISMFVLRSDGTLFKISDYSSLSYKVTSYATGIPATNNEGLCYDEANNRLLIASKGKIAKGAEYKDKRVIYAFDLVTYTLSQEPVYDFNLNSIIQFAEKNNIELPQRARKKTTESEPILKFATSAICIHPLNKKLYLLSAADHMIFVFDSKGNIEEMELLDPQLFNKSEGISFFKNGDMIITNEGQDKKPTLLRFNYQK